MTTPLPPEFIRRGFTTEATRHRTEMNRALARVRQHLDVVDAAASLGRVDTYALRHLVVEAADAAERGFALDAVLEVAKFAQPEESR